MDINNCTNLTTKVWYKHNGGYIIKCYVEPITNKIIEEKIPYNQPNNFSNYLKYYFENKLN